MHVENVVLSFRITEIFDLLAPGKKYGDHWSQFIIYQDIPKKLEGVFFQWSYSETLETFDSDALAHFLRINPSIDLMVARHQSLHDYLYKSNFSPVVKKTYKGVIS